MTRKPVDSGRLGMVLVYVRVSVKLISYISTIFSILTPGLRLTLNLAT